MPELNAVHRQYPIIKVKGIAGTGKNINLQWRRLLAWCLEINGWVVVHATMGMGLTTRISDRARKPKTEICKPTLKLPAPRPVRCIRWLERPVQGSK